jgi:hypothetical protein
MTITSLKNSYYALKYLTAAVFVMCDLTIRPFTKKTKSRTACELYATCTYKRATQSAHRIVLVKVTVLL